MDEGRIGAVRITRIHESVLTEVASAWFLGFDREALRPHDRWLIPNHFDPVADTITMPVHSWLLRDGRRTILIDTCCGNHKDRLGIPGFHQLDTPYLERLAAAGVQPEQVDYVLCTHLHMDHLGWNTRLLDGRWVPTFPNAKYVISRTEYEHVARKAEPESALLNRLIYRDSVLPVVEAGQALFVDGEDCLEDILTIRPAPGHSPGHVRIELSSDGAMGVFSGDLIHSPIQAPFWRWSTRFCEDPAQSAATRRDLLAFCAEHDALLLPGHFNVDHVARARVDGDAFALDFGWG